MSRSRGVLTQAAVVAVALAVWEFGTRGLGDPYFPPPTRIVARLQELWFSGPPAHLWLTDDATANIPPSLGRLLGGWAVAGITGIAMGVALGRSPAVLAYLDPAIRFGRAVPPPMLLPVFLAVFHIGTQMQMVTIVFATVWPVLTNTIDGARSVDPLQLETARVFNLSPAQRLRAIVLPAAAPKIAAGLRLSLSLALILMVVSELVGATNGIGYRLLLVAQRDYDLPAMWGGILSLSALGYILNTMFVTVERRVLARHPPSRHH